MPSTLRLRLHIFKEAFNFKSFEFCPLFSNSFYFTIKWLTLINAALSYKFIVKLLSFRVCAVSKNILNLKL